MSETALQRLYRLRCTITHIELSITVHSRLPVTTTGAHRLLLNELVHAIGFHCYINRQCSQLIGLPQTIESLLDTLESLVGENPRNLVRADLLHRVQLIHCLLDQIYYEAVSYLPADHNIILRGHYTTPRVNPVSLAGIPIHLALVQL